MGLFDEIRCHYPLPIEGGPGYNRSDFKDHVFQTKDTPAMYMDLYEIRADGSLWHEDYDTEDRSDKTKEGLLGLCGMATRVNKRWEPCNMTGEIRFYSSLGNPNKKFRQGSGWIEFSSYFLNGHIQQLHLIEYTQP